MKGYNIDVTPAGDFSKSMDDFAVASERYAAKSKDLREAIDITNTATFAGRFVGAMVSLFAWYFSNAPWWAIPVFAIVIGWVAGQIYGKHVSRGLQRVLQAKWPELGP